MKDLQKQKVHKKNWFGIMLSLWRRRLKTPPKKKNAPKRHNFFGWLSCPQEFTLPLKRVLDWPPHCRQNDIHPWKITYPLKIDGWKTTFLLNGPFSRDIHSFSGRESFLNIILDFWIYIKAYRFPTWKQQPLIITVSPHIFSKKSTHTSWCFNEMSELKLLARL